MGYRGVPKCPQTHSSVRSSALRAVQGCVPRCCPALSLLPAEGSAAPAVAAAAIDLCSLLTSVCAVGKLGLTLSGQKTSNTALPGEEEREETQRGAGRMSCRGCQLLHGHTARPHRTAAPTAPPVFVRADGSPGPALCPGLVRGFGGRVHPHPAWELHAGFGS